MFKKTLPFIAIFALSIGVALTTFVQERAQKAEAAVDGVSIELTGMSTPITKNGTWSWRADLLASNHVGEKVSSETVVSWCRETFGKQGESEGRICSRDLTANEFISELKREKKDLTLQNSNFTLSHPAVSCGRVYLEILGLDGVLGSEVYDTGVGCQDSDIPTPTPTKEPTYGLQDSEGNDISFSEIIRDLFSIFGSKVDEGIIGDEDPSDPNQPTPVPNPNPELATSCPIPNATIVCGSKWNPINGCGHCGQGYGQTQNCQPGWGTEYGLDIKGVPGTGAQLPDINSRKVSWVHVDETRKSGQAIQRYAGRDDDGNTYWLQFHHTAIGSGLGLRNQAQSGSIGGQVCPTCNHVHVQLGIGNVKGNWVDATQYMCR